MTQEWVCWKCGATLAASMPVVARTDECAVCRTDLHVCRLCEFFDERVSRQCRERCPALPTHPFLRHAVALVSPPIMIYARPRVESIPCSGRRLQRRPRL